MHLGMHRLWWSSGRAYKGQQPAPQSEPKCTSPPTSLFFAEAQYSARPENTQRPSGGSDKNMDDARMALEAQQAPVRAEAQRGRMLQVHRNVEPGVQVLPTRLRRAATERCPRASHRPGSKAQIPRDHHQVQWALVR